MSERQGGEAGPGRRRLLRAAGGIATVGLAGCSDLVPGDPVRTADEDAESYTLTVRLEEEDGDPATEASVSVVTEEGLIQRAEATVPYRDGVVTFELEDGEYVVQIESQEYTNVEEPVTVDGEDVELTVVLERGIG
jgi:hypothetical protein